jgi:hypothetical protein
MSQKVITLDELRAHKTKDSFYVLLHNKGERGYLMLLSCSLPSSVYNVTKFIDEVCIPLVALCRAIEAANRDPSTQEVTR